MINAKNIILIGDGAIGSSFAFNCLTSGVGKSLGIIDINMKRVQGDVEDLMDALPYTSQENIYAANYTDCRYADLIVITAGIPQKPGQTRLELVQKNTAIIQDIATQIMANDFNGIILIASNPVDVLTEVVYKTTGLPRNQIIGSGTALDSARLRSEIGQRFNVDARSVVGYIMGEHGDSEFPVWDFTTIGGKPIKAWVPKPQQADTLEAIGQKVKNAAYSIINQKGATFYGIAASLTRITAAILNDDRTPFALSIHLEGEYGLEDVAIGVPAVVGANGLERIIELDLNNADRQKLTESAQVLQKTYQGIQK
ncbi:L-lactate dehydrogenase [Lactobacillus sp. CC-MHH1034]|uniref:L-lactate dehydrogenase n=1 Tax=Agrilactobacillus fermenti TaxID=2586909 RepID=UPI001E2D44D3|nr:L-lactate dehydrogenase [Agrilactobacillus fermenti]MCD2256716.1 L-lactate dehydrogenase [Agrilactobacillus fermenti]